jgi:hypothetical protein
VLKIHETYGDGDALTTVYLVMHEAELVLSVRAGETDTRETNTVLPQSVLLAVFERYARPLEQDTALTGPILEVGQGIAVQHLRHLSPFDVIARDYLVLRRPGKEPIADLAVSITVALLHLAKRAAPV